MKLEEFTPEQREWIREQERTSMANGVLAGVFATIAFFALAAILGHYLHHLPR